MYAVAEVLLYFQEKQFIYTLLIYRIILPESRIVVEMRNTVPEAWRYFHDRDRKIPPQSNCSFGMTLCNFACLKKTKKQNLFKKPWDHRRNTVHYGISSFGNAFQSNWLLFLQEEIPL